MFIYHKNIPEIEKTSLEKKINIKIFKAFAIKRKVDVNLQRR